MSQPINNKRNRNLISNSSYSISNASDNEEDENNEYIVSKKRGINFKIVVPIKEQINNIKPVVKRNLNVPSYIN